jgi:alpha-1,6-mannosyltransferase
MTTPRVTTSDRRLGAGVVGSGLLAVGGYGVGAAPASLSSQWLRETTPGRALSYTLCAIGVVLLITAWWALRDATARLVATAAVLWSLPLLLTVPLFSRDVYAYAAQGHLVDVGLDPYAHGPADAPGPMASEVDDVWARARSPYGPVFLRVAAWLTPGQHVVVATLLLRLLAVAGLVLLGWALMRLAREPAPALWLTVANPLVLLHGIGGAHNDLLMAGLLAAGVAVAVAGGVAALVGATALVVVAALVKAPAAGALFFLPLLRHTDRMRAAAVVAVAAVASAVALAFASGLGWGWVHTLGAGNARRSLLSVSTGLGALIHNVSVGHAVGLTAAGVLCVLLLARADRVGVVRALGLALLAVACLGPVVQPWYLLWALPLLAAVAGTRMAVGLAAASAVVCVLILPSGRHLIRPPLYGVPAVIVAAVAYAAARRDVTRAATDATT